METNATTKSAKSYSTEEKQELVERWKQSGKSMMAFSKQLGINYHTFVWWIKPKKNKQKVKALPPAASPGFVELKINSREEGKLFARLTVGKAHVDFFHPLQADYLKQLTGL